MSGIQECVGGCLLLEKIKNLKLNALGVHI